jgi:hypothetical protein
MNTDKHILKFDKIPLLRPNVIKENNTNSCFSHKKSWFVDGDWKYKIDNKEYIIKGGFIFDDASIPLCCRSCRNPRGVLLIATLIHGWGYSNDSLLRVSSDINNVYYIKEKKTRKEIDIIFRDISSDIECCSYISYYLLYIFGCISWNNSITSVKNDETV